MDKPWLEIEELIRQAPIKGAYLSAPPSPNAVPLFRLAIWRIWDSTLPLLAVAMQNPSRGDARIDDHTITRVNYFAKAGGYGGWIGVNLYAYRSTDPMDLLKFGLLAAVGPNNDDWIRAATTDRDVLVAWGAGNADRVAQVVKIIQPVANKVLCLGTTADGSPRHPSRLSNEAALEAWQLPKVFAEGLS